jgi:hypothetical protein
MYTGQIWLQIRFAGKFGFLIFRNVGSLSVTFPEIPSSDQIHVYRYILDYRFYCISVDFTVMNGNLLLESLPVTFISVCPPFLLLHKEIWFSVMKNHNSLSSFLFVCMQVRILFYFRLTIPGWRASYSCIEKGRTVQRDLSIGLA